MPNYDVALLIKVAEMYFYQGASQKEISKSLGISAATVSRLLKDGFDSKIIKVEIADINRTQSDIAERIRRHYGLEAVVIADVPAQCSQGMLKKYLGQAAKSVLKDLLTPDCYVGLGVGETISEMALSFKQGEVPFNINAVSMMGGWCNSGLSSESYNILNQIASTLGCSCFSLVAPAVLKNPKTKELLKEEPEIMRVTELWKKMNIAVFGIGPSINKSDHRDIYPVDYSGITGDICGWALNRDGEVVPLDLNNRLMVIPPEQLKAVPVRLGIGGGKTKCANTVSALNGGFMTHLVTDSETAKYINDILEDET